VKIIVVLVTLALFYPGFSQVTREETISFSGPIDNIPKDSKFIVVNERRVFIPSNTTIASEKGSMVRINDLRIRLYVAIEGVRKPDGIYARKITVLKSPEIKP
jgi:hypothetical protein